MNDEDVSFARSQLLSQADLQTAENGAEFDDGDRHVKWTAEIEPAGARPTCSRVTFTCTVTEPSAPGPRTVVETFMLLRPTWSDPTDAEHAPPERRGPDRARSRGGRRQ